MFSLRRAQEALSILGFSAVDQSLLWRTLSLVLRLGNIAIVAHGSVAEQADIRDDDPGKARCAHTRA